MTREVDWSAMIEKEPITVLLSQRGWIRAMRGHLAQGRGRRAQMARGRRAVPRFPRPDHRPAGAVRRQWPGLHAGRRQAARRPRVRRAGAVADRPRRRRRDHRVHGRAAASEAAGRVVGRARVRDAGRSDRWPRHARASNWSICAPAPGSRWCAKSPRARIRSRRSARTAKCWCSRWPSCRNWRRGQGVTLQRYRDGGLADAVAFRFADGLSWALGGESGRVRTESDLTPWRAARGAAGRMPPLGFPRTIGSA